MTALENRTFPAAFRVRRTGHPLAATAVFALVAAIAYLLLLGLGPTALGYGEVFAALTGGGSRQAVTIVWDLRLPVAIATVVVGAALGLAGSWTITMSRNPLASPDFLGISGGASVAVVGGISIVGPALGLALDAFWPRAGLAMLGALVVLAVLLALGGFGSSRRIVLIGFALALMCQSAVSFILLRTDLNRAASSQLWLAGSTGLVRSDAVLPLVLGLVPFVLVAAFVGRHVPLLAHDDDTASSLGVDVARVRAVLLVCATGLVAVTVSVVGPVVFVALVSPHLARLVARTSTPPQWASAAAGAAVLGTCAVVAALLPVSAPVGLLTCIVGGVTLVVLTLHGLRATDR